MKERKERNMRKIRGLGRSRRRPITDEVEIEIGQRCLQKIWLKENNMHTKSEDDVD